MLQLDSPGKRKKVLVASCHRMQEDANTVARYAPDESDAMLKMGVARSAVGLVVIVLSTRGLFGETLAGRQPNINRARNHENNVSPQRCPHHSDERLPFDNREFLWYNMDPLP